MFLVALLAEGVDRNTHIDVREKKARVALLAEGVDRNCSLGKSFLVTSVALLAEGVDRNTVLLGSLLLNLLSPSSRRAWIEIEVFAYLLGALIVALLAEGVDRNADDCPVTLRPM